MSTQRGHEAFAYSLSDLMAGVAVVFLLIAIIFMVRAARATEAARAQAAQLTESQVAVSNEIEELSEVLTHDSEVGQVARVIYNQNVDPYLLTVVFKDSRLNFPESQCDLPADAAAALRVPLSHILGHICQVQSRGIIDSISLEGHTDQKPSFPRDLRCGAERRPNCTQLDSTGQDCASLGFANNVRLSAARAQNVFFAMRDMFAADDAMHRCIEANFVVAGRGPVEPIDGRAWDGPHTAEENHLNRRVVLKIRARVPHQPQP